MNEIYTGQQKLDELNWLFISELVRNVITNDPQSDYRTYRIITVYLGDVLNAEETLLQQYGGLLAILDQPVTTH